MRLAIMLSVAAMLLAACPAPSAITTCQSNDDCQSDELCFGGTCRRACNSSAECNGDESCFNGVCQPGSGQRDAAPLDGAARDHAASDQLARDLTPGDLVTVDRSASDTAPRDRTGFDGAVRDRWSADSAAIDRVDHDGASSDRTCSAPINGGWSAVSWQDWINVGGCVSCAQQQQRTGTRSCTDPPPSCGGADCQGSTSVTETQSVACGAVSGGWGGWSGYSACSHDCDGTQNRTRLCDSPAPACGGAYCSGCGGMGCPYVDTETVACNPASAVCGDGWWSCSTSHTCQCAAAICTGGFCRADYGCCTNQECYTSCGCAGNTICDYDHVCSCYC